MRDVRRRLRLLAALLATLLAGADVAMAQMATTTVQDTIYSADGTPASGTVVVSWSAFTTAGGSSVPAGSTSVTIGAGGVLTIALAPNADATPMGSYYTAVLHLNDGTTSRQYWVVPVTVPGGGPARLAAIQNQVLPTSVAMQTVSRQYVDTAIARAVAGVPASSSSPYVLKTGDTMTGPLVLPADPVSPNQAADKNYIDSGLAALAAAPVAASRLPLFGPSGSGHAPGMVPDPGATAGATRYLREDRTWATPAGGGSSAAAQTYWASPGGNGITQQVNVANAALCTPFYVQAAGGLSVGHISFVVEAADGTNNSDVSINNGTTGALIADIGAQHLGSTGVVNAAFVQGTVTIPAGRNFLCETSAGSMMALYFYQQVPVSYLITSGSLATTSGGAMGAITVPNDSTATPGGVGPWILLYP